MKRAVMMGNVMSSYSCYTLFISAFNSFPTAHAHTSLHNQLLCIACDAACIRASLSSISPSSKLRAGINVQRVTRLLHDGGERLSLRLCSVFSSLHDEAPRLPIVFLSLSFSLVLSSTFCLSNPHLRCVIIGLTLKTDAHFLVK